METLGFIEEGNIAKYLAIEITGKSNFLKIILCTEHIIMKYDHFRSCEEAQSNSTGILEHTH